MSHHPNISFRHPFIFVSEYDLFVVTPIFPQCSSHFSSLYNRSENRPQPKRLIFVAHSEHGSHSGHLSISVGCSLGSQWINPNIF